MALGDTSNRLAVGMVLAAHAAALVYSAWRFAPTLNEPTRVAAGLAIWYRGEFTLDIDNPPLVKILGAWPAALVAAEPPLEHTPFSTTAAQQFLYLNGERATTYIFLGRLACIPFSLLGAWICYRWARELYGTAAGLGAMVLWCTSPFMLGYGWTVVADVPAAALLAAAWRSYHGALREGGVSRWLAASVWLGTAVVVKFTALLMLPLYGLVWLWRFVGAKRAVGGQLRAESMPSHAEGTPLRGEREGPHRFWLVAGAVLLGGTALVMIGAIYLFQGWGTPLHKLRAEAARRILIPPAQRDEAERRELAPQTWWERLPIPLPREYVMSLYSLKRIHGSTPIEYMAGEWRDGPPWYFYLYGLGCKTPEGTFVLLGLALACGIWGGKRFEHDFWVLLPALWLLAALAAGGGTSMHLRYAIPVLPFFYVWASRVLAAGRAWRWAGWLAIAGASAGSLAQYPHSLAYFNLLAGGPSQGHRHLLSSELDWGQDLFELRRWVDAHPEAANIKIAYFGIMHPGQVGLRNPIPPLLKWPAGVADAIKSAARVERQAAGAGEEDGDAAAGGPPPGKDALADDARRWAEPGWYAVSVSYVMGGISPVTDGTSRLHILKGGDLSYFQLFEPVARAGRSIWIYHLTAEDWQRLFAQGWRPVEQP